MDNTIISVLMELLKKRDQQILKEMKEIDRRNKRIDVLKESKKLILRQFEIERSLDNSQGQLELETPKQSLPLKNQIHRDRVEQEGSIVDNIVNILEVYKRPMTAPEILKILKERHKAPSGKNPRNVVYSMLHTYCSKGQRFYKDNGSWGLLKWKETEKEETVERKPMLERHRDE